MAYQCPRCNRNVRRGAAPAGVGAGLFESLLCAAMGSFDCPQCGPISQDEFSPEVQKKMAASSMGMVAVGAVLVAIVIIVAVVINHAP